MRQRGIHIQLLQRCSQVWMSQPPKLSKYIYRRLSCSLTILYEPLYLKSLLISLYYPDIDVNVFHGADTICKAGQGDMKCQSQQKIVTNATFVAFIQSFISLYPELLVEKIIKWLCYLALSNDTPFQTTNSSRMAIFFLVSHEIEEKNPTIYFFQEPGLLSHVRLLRGHYVCRSP